MSYPLVYKHFCLTNYGSFFALYRKVKCTAFWNTAVCAVHNISCCTFCQTEYICQVLCVKRKHNKHSQNRHENLQDGRLVKSTCNSSRGVEKRSLGLDGGRVTFCTVTSSPLLSSPPPLYMVLLSVPYSFSLEQASQRIHSLSVCARVKGTNYFLYSALSHTSSDKGI